MGVDTNVRLEFGKKDGFESNDRTIEEKKMGVWMNGRLGIDRRM